MGGWSGWERNAASVGVKIPASIPPKIIIGVKSGSIAPLNEIKTSLNEAL